MTGKGFPRHDGPVSRAVQQTRAVERARATNRDWIKQRNDRYGSGSNSWTRETRVLPRQEAREFARAFLKKYPKAAYWSEVESWRVLEGDVIEFTMRRLPSAD